MKRVLSLILCIVLVVGIMPQISFAEGNFRVVKNDGMEKYEVNESLNVNTHPSFCGFGTGLGKTVITDEFAHTGSKSIIQSGRVSLGGSIKIHNLFGRKLTQKDVGKTFELSFYVYADKNSGVYKKSAEGVAAEERGSYKYTEEELKDSTKCIFSVYLAGPDGKSYKYRTGTIDTKKYDVPWNEWTNITYQYTVKEEYLPTDSTGDKTDPYLDSVRVGPAGNFSINQACPDTIYMDDVTVKELGATSFQQAKTDDIESHSTDEVLAVNKHPDFCGFGEGVGNTYITDKFAHSGNKSIIQTGRTSGNATVKLHNLFGRQLTAEDIGRTFLLKFYVYADKESGVYKQDVIKVSKEERDNYKYTEEELKESTGCEFYVYPAGPDDKKYMHRTGLNDSANIKKFHVPWNQWTPVNYYYTVTEEYLSNGATEDKSDPYIDSVRMGQTGSKTSIDKAYSDTFYIDDITVNEVGATIESSYKDGRMYVMTQYTESCPVVDANVVAVEYDASGRLIGAKIQPAPVSDDKTSRNLMEYDTKENDSNVYVTILNDLNPFIPKTEIPRIHNTTSFVIPSDGWERAEKILSMSKAEYKDALSFDERIDKENEYFQAVSDVYVSMKKPDSKPVSDKYLKVSTEYASVMKFDISRSSKQSFSHAYFSIYAESVTTPGKVELYAINSDWDEETVTYNKISSNMQKLCELDVGYKDLVFYFDISSYANEMVRKNADTLSFCMKTSDGNISFISWRSTQRGYKASLIFEGIGMKEGEKKVSSFDYSNYVNVDKKKDRGTKGSYIPTPTRILSSLKDYTPVTEAPKLNKYGSPITAEKYEATGFFYMKQIDGRWWFIDPEGYKQLHIGVGVVRPEKNTEKEINAFNAKYGTDENWANMVVDELRPYGFNGCGFVGNYKLMLDATEATPLNQVGFGYILQGYDSTYNDEVMNVFDPGFEKRADNIAKSMVDKYADNPHVMGWSFDNEPPASNNMLKACLTTDKYDPKTAYNYYTAWAWFKQRHGENATISDITDKDKMDWVEFTYDIYLNICVTAIRKYDQNHLIFGPKLDKPNQGSFRGLSKWVDVVCYDYYGNAWTAEHSQMDSFYRWSGRPLINAEWYAKGADACTEETGLTNFSGVGYQATTQVGRGHYYQNFVINMLESKAFIGWHWFRYIDNPGVNKFDEGADTNANKGLYTNFYTPWTELLSQMKLINENVYSMMDYFDEK